MTDLVITAADVARVDGSVQTKNAGVAIVAGDSVFVDSNGVLQLSINDDTAIEAASSGVALNDGAVGQPVTYQVSGNLDVGATLVIGETYVVGAALGGLAPVADIASSEFATVVGIATAADNLKMGLLPSGVAHA